MGMQVPHSNSPFSPKTPLTNAIGIDILVKELMKKEYDKMEINDIMKERHNRE
jgi:hypothetical protein